MDWEAIGAIGEVVGAAAVVVTLGYLALQFRQNARMMKATMRQEFAKLSIDVVFRAANHPTVSAKIHSQKIDWETPEEEMTAHWIMTAAFRAWENAAWMHDEGLIPTSEWLGLVADMKYRASFPYCIQQWQQTREWYSELLRKTADPIFSSAGA